ncbi:unnamed protein product [Rotaria socialis]|uniref:Tc1-like transposase DDE domain-containing protein n=2 Tax=Rotaria socialis TaxID=392032 RepID=A0A817RBI8_9BILA|nr:unnamed protein product [Rotaria socialis]
MLKNVTMDNQSSYKKVKHLEKDEKKHSPALTTAHKDLRLSGGSVMIWASFGWGGKSSICFVDGRMNAKGYREVLKKHLIDIGSCMGGSDWIFQQDNAPIHRAKVNLAWFKSKKINVLPWPSLSPDLNPIENLWGILARKVYSGGKQFRTKEQLKTTIIKSWEEISIEQLRALVKSMPERIFEVIKLNGAKTKY